MRRAFYLGVDVCDAGTTLSLIEKASSEKDGAPPADYHVHTVNRVDPGTAVDDLKERVRREISDRPYTGNTSIVVNRSTKEGAQLAEALGRAGASPITIALTGDGPSPGANGLVDGKGTQSFNVKRQALVQRLSDMYHSGRIRITSEETVAETQLLENLFTDIAPENAAENSDSLPLADVKLADAPSVRSAAIAVYIAEEQSLDPTEELEGDVPPTSTPPPAVP